MARRYPTDPVLWSNLLFFGNSYLWYVCGSLLACIVIAITALASLLYHWFREENDLLHRLDQFCASVALCVTLFAAGASLTLHGWILVCVVLLAGLAFKIEAHNYWKTDRYYDGYHVAWHMTVFAGQLCLALSLKSEIL